MCHSLCSYLKESRSNMNVESGRPTVLLYFAWANERPHQCFIHHTARFTWRCELCDNGDSFSLLSYTRNKAGKMRSTIKPRKVTCCMHNNGTQTVVSRDHTALGYQSNCQMPEVSIIHVHIYCVIAMNLRRITILSMLMFSLCFLKNGTNLKKQFFS